MQEYHQKPQKSPIDAQARIMGSLQPRTPRPPRLLYVLLILPLIMVFPTGSSAIGSKILSSDVTPDRQYGGRSKTILDMPVNGCACSNASPRQVMSITPGLRTGTAARWHRVLPASVRSRIGVNVSTPDARCIVTDKYACLSVPKLPQTMPPSAVRNGRQSVQLHTPHKS